MRQLVFAILLSFVAGLAAKAGATTLPVEGGPGGGYFEAACPAGQYVVGFSVRAGAWIDAIAPLCAPYSAERMTFGQRTRGAFHGGNGGAPQEAYCLDRQMYVHGIYFGWTRQDAEPQFVNDVGFRCSRPGSPYDAVQGTREGEVLMCIATGEAGCGDITPLASNLFTEMDQTCPLGEAVTGIHGRSGDFLDALGLICGPEPSGMVMGHAKPQTGAASTLLQGGGLALNQMPMLPGAAGTQTGATPSLPQGGGLALNQMPTLPGAAGTQPAPASTQPASYPLDCLGGGHMQATSTQDGFVRITFAPAAQGSLSAPPRPGECAWTDRGFRSGEPQMLVYGGGGREAKDLVKAVTKGKAFQVHAYNDDHGAMVITSIDGIGPRP